MAERSINPNKRTALLVSLLSAGALSLSACGETTAGAQDVEQSATSNDTDRTLEPDAATETSARPDGESATTTSEKSNSGELDEKIEKEKQSERESLQLDQATMDRFASYDQFVVKKDSPVYKELANPFAYGDELPTALEGHRSFLDQNVTRNVLLESQEQFEAATNSSYVVVEHDLDGNQSVEEVTLGDIFPNSYAFDNFANPELFTASFGEEGMNGEAISSRLIDYGLNAGLAEIVLDKERQLQQYYQDNPDVELERTAEGDPIANPVSARQLHGAQYPVFPGDPANADTAEKRMDLYSNGETLRFAQNGSVLVDNYTFPLEKGGDTINIPVSVVLSEYANSNNAVLTSIAALPSTQYWTQEYNPETNTTTTELKEYPLEDGSTATRFVILNTSELAFNS